MCGIDENTREQSVWECPRRECARLGPPHCNLEKNSGVPLATNPRPPDRPDEGLRDDVYEVVKRCIADHVVIGTDGGASGIIGDRKSKKSVATIINL